MSGLTSDELIAVRELLAELRSHKNTENSAAKSAAKTAKTAKTKTVAKSAAKSKANGAAKPDTNGKGGIERLSAAAPKELRDLKVKGEIHIKGSMSPYNKAIAGWGGSFRAVEEGKTENGSVVRTYKRRPTTAHPEPDDVELVVCTQEKWIKRTR